MSDLRAKFSDSFQGKTVLVTGHTGFKGAWLCEWLLMLGARVVGVALQPNTEPALFDMLRLAERIEHHVLDIRDREALTQTILATEPDYLFHLAAQPLVRLSYAEPVETYETNLMGTVHVLDALRQLENRYLTDGRLCATVMVTSDKCYENREWLYGYREEDALGGYDPYSSSKGAAELAISAYRRSFFNPTCPDGMLHVGIASGRAGNVIGGGDWAEDRIVPDCIRHLRLDEPVPVRNAAAIRPWQHVLEPLGGYLQLAARQYEALQAQEISTLEATCTSYNFGPSLPANRPVRDLVEEILEYWSGSWRDQSDPQAPHESGRLNLSWDKAFHQLGWHPRWNFEESVRRTMVWYLEESANYGADAIALTQGDINAYMDTSSWKKAKH